MRKSRQPRCGATSSQIAAAQTPKSLERYRKSGSGDARRSIAGLALRIAEPLGMAPS
jgi:hypothetical protein